MAQTATPTLAQLRRECKVRLMDFEKPPKFLDAIYDYEINRQLDLWTRDTSILQVNYLTDIVAGVNPTVVVPLPGYQLGQVLNMAIRQSSQTVLNLEIRTPKQMYHEFVNWPDTATNASTSMYAIFDFDPATNGHILNSSVMLWPGPSTSWVAPTGGLVVTCKAVTDGLLVNDNDSLPMLARYAKEPIVEKVCAALLGRIADPLSAYHDAEGRAESTKIRRAAGLERGKVRGSTCYNV